MSKSYFLLGVHCHQPVGNFDFVFEENYRKAYLPFIEMLRDFEKIKIAVHYSGPLLEWIEDKHPEFLEILKSLLEKERIELISGGFYEPILPAIPYKDAIGQISYMSSWLQKRFGITPRGLWLPERAWEPHLPSLLKDAGIDFTFLDDFHFLGAGVAKSNLSSYHITEDQNKKIAVFPILKSLRYAVPFKSAEETIGVVKFKSEGNDGDSLAVLFDDGEKFGTWPGTFQHVYEFGWLENFFRAVSSDDEIEMILPSDALKKIPPNGLTYFPASSYFELTQWCLPTKARIAVENLYESLRERGEYECYEGLVRGGFWRNYLSKYPEANHLNKRVAALSELVDAKDISLDEKKILIWKSQCNCAYWHGIFGGIYLPHLRESLYRNLLAAENKYLSEVKGDSGWSEISYLDLDCDQIDELVYQDSLLTVVVNPQKGGMITELSDKEKLFNFANCLARREESYHSLLKNVSSESSENVATIHDKYSVKDKNVLDFLFYDTDSLGVFFEIISHQEQSEDIFRSDLIFDSRKVKRDFNVLKKAEAWELDFVTDKNILFNLKNKKIIFSNSKKIVSEYHLENFTDHCLYFRCIMCLLCPEPFSDRRYFSFPGDDEKYYPGKQNQKAGFGLKYTDEVVGSVLFFSSALSMDWSYFPAYSVNLSEEGFEKNLQSVIVSAGKWFCPDRNENLEIEIKL
ncbi:DUF1926 domain-containing protein [candidate division WOR-3 bacterium]|nr:DUF1926 domain-containing protein [candidate division WOR-3 bacterium]